MLQGWLRYKEPSRRADSPTVCLGHARSGDDLRRGFVGDAALVSQRSGHVGEDLGHPARRLPRVRVESTAGGAGGRSVSVLHDGPRGSAFCARVGLTSRRRFMKLTPPWRRASRENLPRRMRSVRPPSRATFRSVRAPYRTAFVAAGASPAVVRSVRQPMKQTPPVAAGAVPDGLCSGGRLARRSPKRASTYEANAPVAAGPVPDGLCSGGRLARRSPKRASTYEANAPVASGPPYRPCSGLCSGGRLARRSPKRASTYEAKRPRSVRAPYRTAFVAAGASPAVVRSVRQPMKQTPP